MMLKLDIDGDKLNCISFIVLLGLVYNPYSVAPVALTLSILVIISSLYLFFVNKYDQLYSCREIWLLFMLTSCHFTVALLYQYDLGVVVSQSNHFFQFCIMFIVFINIFLRIDFDRLKSLRLFFITSLIIIIFYVVKVRVYGYSDYSGYDICVAFYSIQFLYVTAKLSDQKTKYLIPFLCLSLLIFIADRASFLLISFICVFYGYLRPGAFFTYLSCLLVIILPLAAAGFITDDLLSYVYSIDYNTAIRIEFLQSAFSVVSFPNFIGVGFGEHYRNEFYVAFLGHTLLSDTDSLSLVSNHNSIFDTFYRLGILGVSLLLYLLFFKHKISRMDSTEGFSMVVLSIGLSVDAWMENQLQLPAFSFLISYLIAKRLRPEKC